MQSGYGFHIIRVDDKQAAHVKTLDEVEEQIEESIKQQKAAQAADQPGGRMLAQARNGGLDKAAAAQGIQVSHYRLRHPHRHFAGHRQLAAIHERRVRRGRKGSA